jgi:hypothetical protein
MDEPDAISDVDIDAALVETLQFLTVRRDGAGGDSWIGERPEGSGVHGCANDGAPSTANPRSST